MATHGRDGVDSTTMVSVCRPEANERWKSTALATKAGRQRSTRATIRPSRRTSAAPRVGPIGPIQLTDEPLNMRVAVEPGDFDQATLPPK